MTLRAHSCEVSTVSKDKEKAFLEENHIQGFAGSEVAYGLLYNDELVEIMTFGKPRFQRKEQFRWEIIRLCTKKDVIVHGGASKLFSHFQENNEDSNSVISFCNLDFFDGKVYEALGFRLNHIVRGYHYEKDGQRYNRQSFMRKTLAAKFNKPEYEDYDKWTERSIMENEGFLRVDDIKGQALFIYNGSEWPKYYTYRILFEDGSTYIGSHIQYKEDDSYITSSTYSDSHILSKKIIAYYNTRKEMYEAETHQILMDRAISPKNVNGNNGGTSSKPIVYNIPDSEKRLAIGRKISATKQRLRRSGKPRRILSQSTILEKTHKLDSILVGWKKTKEAISKECRERSLKMWKNENKKKEIVAKVQSSLLKRNEKTHRLYRCIETNEIGSKVYFNKNGIYHPDRCHSNGFTFERYR